MPKALLPNETAPAVAPEANDQATNDVVKAPAAVVAPKRVLKPGEYLSKHGFVVRDGTESK